MCVYMCPSYTHIVMCVSGSHMALVLSTHIADIYWSNRLSRVTVAWLLFNPISFSLDG